MFGRGRLMRALAIAFLLPGCSQGGTNTEAAPLSLESEGKALEEACRAGRAAADARAVAGAALGDDGEDLRLKAKADAAWDEFARLSDLGAPALSDAVAEWRVLVTRFNTVTSSGAWIESESMQQESADLLERVKALVNEVAAMCLEGTGIDINRGQRL
jgi:hypothetical protein